MAIVKIRGLALREVDFGEHDRYLTILTEDGRRAELLCKGVRRGGKNGKAVPRPFCLCTYVLSEARGKYHLRELDVEHDFWSVTQDIESYALACYLSELALSLTDEWSAEPVVTRVLLGALYALTVQQRPSVLVKAAAEWRLMAACGYAPQTETCGVCGREMAAPAAFSVRAGTCCHAACADRLPGAAALYEGTWRAMAHCTSCDPASLYRFALTGQPLEQLGEAAERYTEYHLGRRLQTLAFYKSVCLPITGAKK